MIGKKACCILTVVLCVALFQGMAYAGGWGPYFSWGLDVPTTGIPDFAIDQAERLAQQYGIPQDQIDEGKRQAKALHVAGQVDHVTFGVLYDSAPSRDKLFNYRLTLGFDLATKVHFESASVSIPGFPPIDIGGLAKTLGVDMNKTGYGISMDHTFGFGIIRTELLKWWAGPGLRLNFNYYSLEQSYKAANLSIGGGGETGVNIHISPDVSLCVGGGIHWNAFAYGFGSQSQNLGSFVWGNGPFYFVQVAALFHTGEDSKAWHTQATPQPAPVPQSPSPLLTPLPNQ